MPSSTRLRRAAIPARLAALAGVVLVIVGTFLPWVISGTVARDLYTIAGVAGRLGVLGGHSALPDWLPLVGPACIVPVLVDLLRLHRTAALLGLLLAVACGGFAVAVLAFAAGRSVAGVSLAVTGPITVLAGAVLLAAGAITLLVMERWRRRPRTAVQDASGHRSAGGSLDGPP